MREWMPNQQGWTDRGPRVDTTTDAVALRLPKDAASLVRITNGPKRPMIEYRQPYPQAEVAAIIKKGKLDPRKLTLKEERRARVERDRARGLALHMEDWYGEITRNPDPDPLAAASLADAAPVRPTIGPNRLATPGT
jgi:hypothetical protein